MILLKAKEDKHYFNNFKIIRRNIKRKKLEKFLEIQNRRV